MGDRNAHKNSSTTQDQDRKKSETNIGPHGGKSEREMTTQDKAMFEEDTHGCSKPQDSAGTDSPAGQVAGMTGLNQVNRDMVPAAATPAEDQLAEPTSRRITRSQGAITMNSPQVTRNDNPEPTIRDVMDLLKANHLQTTKALDDIRSQMSDFEQSLQFSQAKIAENECAIADIRKENRDLRVIVNNLTARLDASLDKVEVLEQRIENSERRSREWGLRIHGVPERIRENTRSVLCSIIAENKLAGIDSIEGASKVIEHCHRIGPFQQGKTRAIIANIYSRPLRNQLLKDARDVNNNSNNDIYIAPDMTKADHLLKLKAREQMKRAHGQGKRVVFRKGKLIINSEVVSIE